MFIHLFLNAYINILHEKYEQIIFHEAIICHWSKTISSAPTSNHGNTRTEAVNVSVRVYFTAFWLNHNIVWSHDDHIKFINSATQVNKTHVFSNFFPHSLRCQSEMT